MKNKITVTQGMIFDTPFETGCRAVTAPDARGNFDAYDSEGVLCSFNTIMVERTY